MSKFKIFFLVCLILFNGVVLGGCENREIDQTELSKAGKINRQESLESWYRHEAVLLAFKYRVDEEKVFNILIGENDIMYKSMEETRDLLNEKKLKLRIEQYAEQHGIPTDVIANILIDYESMQSKPSN